jgi:hypothetical protein
LQKLAVVEQKTKTFLPIFMSNIFFNHNIGSFGCPQGLPDGLFLIAVSVHFGRPLKFLHL